MIAGKGDEVAGESRDRRTDDKRRVNNASPGSILRRRGTERLLARGERGRRHVLVTGEQERATEGRRCRARDQRSTGRHAH